MKEDLNLHELHYDENGLNMSLSGEYAQLFMQMLMEFFKQNGGENFLTLTVNDRKGNKYAIIIENCNGVDTPAEKLNRMKDSLKWAHSVIVGELEFGSLNFDREDGEQYIKLLELIK
jgi:hypothetical protein